MLTATDIEAIIILGSLAVGYTAYHFTYHSPRIAAWFAGRLPHERSEIVRHLLYRAIQVLVMGVVPAVLLRLLSGRRLAEYGLRLAWHPGRAAVIAALCVVTVTVIAINPRKERLLGAYPQMRLSEWRLGHLILNAGGWAAYLLAYELMFRGFLLVLLLPYGVGVAVGVNLALYVFAHIPKGLTEAVGAIPFGLLVCLLTLWYGTIWAAFWLHLALALANSTVALLANPAMRVRIGRSSAR